QDPILAQWQYGLGRSVAWTSDAKGQWATEWITWPNFSQFWSQAVRWTIVEGASSGLESQIQLEGDQAIVRAEILEADGGYQNNLDVTLSLVDPNLEQQTLSLNQQAPGLYVGEFRPEETGIYLLRIAGQDGESLVAAQTRGFVMAYSSEYRTPPVDETFFSDLATLGSGQVLSLESPGQAFAHTLPPVQAATELWPWLLLIAVALLPIDVGLRRIIFGKEDLRLFWRRMQERLPQRQAPAQSQPSSAGRLLKVKRQETEEIIQPTGTTLEVVAERDDPAPVTKPPAAEPEQVEESTVQRLMRAKQARQKKDQARK
ncbi:MAG: hypothetical protein AAF485_20320, partial [Chloroflexota bacterium]